MLNFKQFIKENSYLYHNTGSTQLHGIMHYDAAGKTSNYDPKTKTIEHVQDVKGNYVKDKLFHGPVSMSRSKHYKTAPGNYKEREVRLVFNRDKLKQNHKIKPSVGLVTKSGGDQGDVLKGAESRWESEERVHGPISLKHVDKIQLTHNAHQDLLSSRKAYEEHRDRAIRNTKLIPQGKIELHKTNKFYDPVNPITHMQLS